MQAGRPFPQISIPFPDGAKSFVGDWRVYQWARSGVPSSITTSALMALEAWAHHQIEAGRPLDEVLHDVFGPDGSSLAFVPVAVDIVLSHWPEARDLAWPLVATPELPELDDARLNADLLPTDQMLSFEQEASTWPVKRADLNVRPSRRSRLSNTIGYYVFHAKPELLQALRASLEQASNRIWQQKLGDGEDPIHGLHATERRAVRMTYAEHWPLGKVTLDDGSETELRQFQRDPEEQRLFDVEAARVNAEMRHSSVRAKIQFALFDRAKSTPEIVAEGIEWAKALPADAELEPDEDDDQEKFNKEWDRRAVIMAAALAARDYEGPDRNNVFAWATADIAGSRGKRKQGIYWKRSYRIQRDGHRRPWSRHAVSQRSGHPHPQCALAPSKPSRPRCVKSTWAPSFPTLRDSTLGYLAHSFAPR
jgi:hypothetical protein